MGARLTNPPLSFMRMCMEEVMKAAGSDMAVTVKTNMRDGFKGGLEIDECLEVARTLQVCGISTHLQGSKPP